MRTLTVMVLLVLPAPLGAQETRTDSATPAVQGYAPGSPTPSPAPAADRSDPKAVALDLVLPVRSNDQLQQSLSAAEADLRRAQARLSWMIKAGAREDALPEARVSKDQKRWSERLGALGGKQLDGARQACLVALAKQQALELELQLNRKRAERAGSSGDPAASEGLNPVIRELERQTLDAQLKYRRLAHELARTEEEVATQRLDLYKAAK